MKPMPHYILTGRDRPGALDTRLRVREEHLKGLQALQDAGKLVAAGPVRNSEDKPVGTVAIFESDSLESARALMSKDPYIREGVFETWSVEPYLVVFPKGK